MTFQFREHGRYELDQLDDNILVLDATGPWNTEIFARYDKELRDKVVGLNGAPWCHIAVLRNETVLSPDVEGLLNEQMQWRKSTGFVSDTIVYCGNISPHLSREQLSKIFQALGITAYFADSLEQALANLRRT